MDSLHHPAHFQQASSFIDPLQGAQAISQEERWLPVVGYEGYCEISNLGNVRSLGRVVERPVRGNYIKRNRTLKPHLTPKGYARIQLSRDGVLKSHMVHRLVAQAFIPNPYELPEVNHKNGIKVDNRVENLEWITSAANQEHAYEIGLRDPVTKYIIHCKELDITTKGTTKMAEALRERGYVTANPGAIWNCIFGTSATHLGLTFTGSRLVTNRVS